MSDEQLISAWSQFRAALSANAPVSDGCIAAPSGDAAITRELSLIQDEVVQTWFSLHDGAGFNFDGGMILPGNFALSQQRAIEETRMIQEIWAESEPGQTENTSGDPHIAGKAVGTWLPEYVLIGTDTTGGGYFLDLRPGPLHGCIKTWDKVNSDTGAVEAPSLAALITALAHSVATGDSFKYWKPTMTNGWLEWEIDAAFD